MPQASVTFPGSFFAAIVITMRRSGRRNWNLSPDGETLADFLDGRDTLRLFINKEWHRETGGGGVFTAGI